MTRFRRDKTGAIIFRKVYILKTEFRDKIKEIIILFENGNRLECWKIFTEVLLRTKRYIRIYK